MLLKGLRSALLKRRPLWCPVCNKSPTTFSELPDSYRTAALRHGFNRFGTGEMTALATYSCDHCGASDRERLYAYWIQKQIESGKISERTKVLHFAPEEALSTRLKNYGYLDYRTADLMMEGVDYKVDMMSMPFKDSSIDFFICSHVLEHVQDDSRAIAELYRITNMDGFGILMVPISVGLNSTLEDPNVVDEAGRWKHFGQGDHVRLYAQRDYVQRIQRSGFNVAMLGKQHFGRRLFHMLGLKRSSILYIVTKPKT